ncbi:hypothetical protein CEP51_011516 [Fusarium floridanum]|uniref:Uncharacterized protein n=1 Tax=Fusarium floridanum TaxID=1325733 RepID=A0A428RAF4_9HYPO|nr:hypothetical protein CEP51_011516 [Fusarium floridanum]
MLLPLALDLEGLVFKRYSHHLPPTTPFVVDAARQDLSALKTVYEGAWIAEPEQQLFPFPSIPPSWRRPLRFSAGTSIGVVSHNTQRYLYKYFQPQLPSNHGRSFF